MTERQERFIDEYIACGNAAEAARRAGYSAKNANVIGAQNLTKLNKVLEGRLREMEMERVAQAQENLEFLTSVMRGEMEQEVATASGKKVKVSDLSLRIKAAELLLKIEGAFREKIEVEMSSAELLKKTLEELANEFE